MPEKKKKMVERLEAKEPLPKGWKSMSIFDVFTRPELKRINRLLSKDDKEGLKEFLRLRSSKLLKKGLLPDYTYYWLESKKKYLAQVI